jgi:hypothetical protein
MIAPMSPDRVSVHTEFLAERFIGCATGAQQLDPGTLRMAAHGAATRAIDEDFCGRAAGWFISFPARHAAFQSCSERGCWLFLSTSFQPVAL